MIILGVDPGSKNTGFGVIETMGNRMKRLDGGVIKTRPKALLPERLETIYDELIKVIDKNKPEMICVEEAFYAKNVHTTLVLGHARGVILLAARKCGAELKEFAPREIKKALVGNGNADKSQVEYMVKMILGLPEEKVLSDMYDALAAAICGFNTLNALVGR